MVLRSFIKFIFISAIIFLGCNPEKATKGFNNQDSIHVERPLSEFAELVDSGEPIPPISKKKREVPYDSTKFVFFTFALNGINYRFEMFLTAHPEGDTSEFWRSEFHCDSILVIPKDTFSIEFAEFLKTGRYPLDGCDTTRNYNNKWVAKGTAKPKQGCIELVRLIDINRDGFMDILVNDIQKEQIVNSLTDYWIYVPALKRLKYIADLTSPNWGIKIRKTHTYIATGWHMSANENNEHEFYIVDTLRE